MVNIFKKNLRHKISSIIFMAFVFYPIFYLSRHPVSGRVLQIPDVRWERPGVPWPSGHLHGHEPASVPLHHQLLPQYLSGGQAVWWEVQCGDVQTDPAGWVQVSLFVCLSAWFFPCLFAFKVACLSHYMSVSLPCFFGHARAWVSC